MMLNKLKPKSEFSKNVLTLMTGTTIAQTIPIAISPILTRIYSPQDFGLFALFVAITAIFGSIANGRYELAIMLPKKDEDAINIFALGFIIASVVSLVLLVLVVVFNNYFTKFLGNGEISFWLYFVPITVFFTGLWNILNYFNNRKKQYKDLAKAVIVKAIVTAIIQLSVGFIKSGTTGLISGQIISQFFANTKLLKNIIKDKFLILKVSRIRILALLKKYKKFPMHSLPSTLADISSAQLPYLAIPAIFNLTISGHFFLAKKIISLPSSLVSSSMSQVFYQSMIDAKHKGHKLEVLLFKTLKKLILIALPISLFLYFFTPYIFLFVFGKDWTILSEIAKYLSLIFFITFVVSPLSISFSVTLELEKIALWQYLYLVTTCLLLLFFMLNEYSFIVFLISLVIHEYVLYTIYLYIIIHTVRKYDNLNCKGHF